MEKGYAPRTGEMLSANYDWHKSASPRLRTQISGSIWMRYYCRGHYRERRRLLGWLHRFPAISFQIISSLPSGAGRPDQPKATRIFLVSLVGASPFFLDLRARSCWKDISTEIGIVKTAYCGCREG